MIKELVTILFLINGNQYLHKIAPSGSITKDAQIIWDSRVDGPIPVVEDYEIVSRSGNQLVIDPVKQQAKLDKIALEQIKKNQEAAIKEELASLRVKLEAETLTAAETRRLLKLYLKIKGE